MVRLINWHFFTNDIGPIKFAVGSKLLCFVSISFGTNRDSSFHETEILFNANWRSFISSDIDILNGVIHHEAIKRS